MELTEDEIKVIGHSLGVNVYHAKNSKLKKDKKLPKEFYRNRYCADTDKHPNYVYLKELTEKEYMESWMDGNMLWFAVTDKGIDLFKTEFKQYIKL